MRPIDADWLAQRLEEWRDRMTETYGNNDEYVLCLGMVLMEIDEAPTADVPDRKVGKWTEKEVIHAEEAKETITEWQSCKCSVCGRYDTRPYLYYFDEPRFCSWCGADMRQDDPSHPFADDVMMKGEADAETD